jgi:hypothetical protein
VATVALLAASAFAGRADALPATSSAAKPGLAGRPITLAKHVTITGNGVDIATSKSGTAYVGWISEHATGRASSDAIFLCVLPLHATSCKGGTQSTPSLDKNTARDLKVLAAPNGTVTLIWFDDKRTSTSGPRDGQIVESTVSNGSLSGARVVADAPTNGDLLDAELAPDGSVWTVATGSIAVSTIEVRPGITNAPVTLRTPFGVGFGRIAFSGSQAVVTVQKDGALTTPDSYTYLDHGAWAKFHSIARTWSGADPGLVSTKTGIRYISTLDDASYAPVVSRWTGSSFTTRQPIGGHSACFPSSHDSVTDASGRVADISLECDSSIAVANLADTFHAATALFRPAGEIAGSTPQIATTPRGDAWVSWSIESSPAASGMTLKVQAFRLPGLQQQSSRQGRHGHVMLTGPASCMPDDTISVGVVGHGDPHWVVASHRLSLGTKTLSSTLDGASLRAGKQYTLKGSVTFRDGGSQSTVTTELRFQACSAP